MAVTRVNQGEIVEVPFELPDGSILPHPALVLSRTCRHLHHHRTAYLLLLPILIIECTGRSGGQHVDDILQHPLLIIKQLDFLHQKKLYEKPIANKMSRAFIQSSTHLIVYN